MLYFEWSVMEACDQSLMNQILFRCRSITGDNNCKFESQNCVPVPNTASAEVTNASILVASVVVDIKNL
jgi:hypothetical protein